MAKAGAVSYKRWVCKLSLKSEVKFQRMQQIGKVNDSKKNVIQEETAKLRIWDPCWSNQVRSQLLGGFHVVVNWTHDRWNINGPKYRS